MMVCTYLLYYNNSYPVKDDWSVKSDVYILQQLTV
jgi:hypothetical protein